MEVKKEKTVGRILKNFNVAAKYQNLNWQEDWGMLLEEVAWMTEVDNMKDNKDAVTFMSLHHKGLEFDTVFSLV